jgi:hypothetical protein
MIKINRQFVLTNTKDKLIDLLRYTLDNSINMLIGGAIMLIYMGQQPMYNPELILSFVAAGLFMSFFRVVADTVWPDKA